MTRRGFFAGLFGLIAGIFTLPKWLRAEEPTVNNMRWACAPVVGEWKVLPGGGGYFEVEWTFERYWVRSSKMNLTESTLEDFERLGF